MKTWFCLFLVLLFGMTQGVCCMEMQEMQKVDAECCASSMALSESGAEFEACDCVLKKNVDRASQVGSESPACELEISTSYFDLHPWQSYERSDSEIAKVIPCHDRLDEMQPVATMRSRVHLVLQVQVI